MIQDIYGIILTGDIMLNIKEGILDSINKWNNNYYIVTDFDRTITAGDSESSWGTLSKSNSVPKEYVEERQKLYNKYRPIEIDLTLDYETKNKLMIEWWTNHINLFIKYKLKESVIKNTAQNPNMMKFRDGAQEFLKKMHDKNIPIIIISAGIGNFIKEFLIQNNALYDNIYIVANFIKFENGIATGISNNIIHSLNKNDISIPNEVKDLIKDKENIVLLGDGIDDIKMVSEDKKDTTLKIGFLNANTEKDFNEYMKAFDVVGHNNASFNELMDTFNIFK